MDKKVLVLCYSQTGQLREIAERFVEPFKAKKISVEVVQVEPSEEAPFAFPWDSRRFFDVMPESVLCKPIPLKPFQLQSRQYDLIILAYQPWFLSPSLPATSLLKHPEIIPHLQHTPVITLIGARNMWINAHEKVKHLLKEAGSHLVGNAVLVDPHPNLISAITILYWMFYGKKDRLWGIFPEPGISKHDMQYAEKYGKLACTALLTENFSTLQQQLIDAGAVPLKDNLIFIEERAGRLFYLWAHFISQRKNRRLWLTVFKYYLLIALFVVAPVLLMINLILLRPFTGGQMQRKKQYYAYN
ncbi:MAG: dialkylrecorsinol condensing protein DarA [Chitinophagales bacterium]|nr:MAG: dialkylrecorsinol condensing protein DarA [Chitinophagales bacterium]